MPGRHPLAGKPGRELLHGNYFGSVGVGSGIRRTIFVAVMHLECAIGLRSLRQMAVRHILRRCRDQLIQPLEHRGCPRPILETEGSRFA